MAKISRFRPTEAGIIRIELDITPQQLIQASYFRPLALTVRETNNNKTETTFTVTPSSETEIGRYGARLAVDPQSTEPVLITHQFLDLNEEELLAKAAQLQGHLTTIEAQVLTAIKDLEEARAAIEEV